MSKMTVADWVKAKPRAVPRNGAVQGVASTVAKTPWKNEPTSPCIDPSAATARRLAAGRFNDHQHQRQAEKPGENSSDKGEATAKNARSALTGLLNKTENLQ